MCIDSTVFLIDHDAAVLDALSISLHIAGLKVEAYPSGKAFLEAYGEERPGCLLINLGQPEMDGLTLQRELIRRNFLNPIIFMTEIGTIQDLLPTMRPGAFLFLEKPFPRLLLLESVREAKELDCINRQTMKTQAEPDN